MPVAIFGARAPRVFFAVCDLEGMTDLEDMTDFDPEEAEEEAEEVQEEVAEAEREAEREAEQFEEDVLTLYAAASPSDVAYWYQEYNVGLRVVRCIVQHWRGLSPELHRDLLEVDPSIAESLTWEEASLTWEEASLDS